MIGIDDVLLAAPPYSLGKDAKAAMFRDKIAALTRHHAAHCAPYGKILAGLGFDPVLPHDLVDYPFLPARIFKSRMLRSVADADVRKTLTSSGTTGQNLSRIFLDGETAALQTKILTRIVSDFIGPQRLPMLIIDAPGTVKKGAQFSARAVGILGYSLFGRNHTYALRDDMSLDVEAIEAFQEKYRGQPQLAFGFTFIIYRHFLKALEDALHTFDLNTMRLIHGGGWKKLADLAIDNTAFKNRLRAASGMAKVHNYYGTVEQTGSIFMECEQGHIHCSNFSDIFIRDGQFAPLGAGKRGLIQMLSLVPHSYPGHNLLTEDEGTILGEDDCACGRKGKYFQIHGRTAQAEMRGCSDTYAVQ